MPHRFVLLAAALIAVLLAAPGVHAQRLVACEGGTASGFACDGVDLYARLSPQALGAPSTCPPFGSACASEVWGWTDAASGREFALVGLVNGVAFVEVTVPDVPVFLGRLPPPSGVGNSLWQTVRVYEDHAFIGSEADNHGVQVFDLSGLLDVQSPPVTFTEDARYTGSSSAHTLTIDEATGYLYVTGGSGGSCGSGLHIVDVRTPLSPTYAGCYSGVGYVHEAQCLVYDGPDPDYTGRELCVAYTGDYVAFIDVTNKTSASLISRAYYPNTGYTHQGWFTEDRSHVLVDDEFDSASQGTRTIVIEAADLDAPSYAFSYYGPLHTTAHNIYVRDQYAFLSNYEGGLHILDVSDVSEDGFVEVGSFDTYPMANSNGYEGQWHNYPYFESGNVLVSDQTYGLFVLKPTRLSTAAEPPSLPAGAGYVLGEPVPNPTSSAATLTLAVARPQAVRAEALDVAGRRVAVLHDGPVAAGAAVALRLDGARLPAGLYLVRVVGEDFTALRRVSLVR
jgi:choice-of-anchor B domain-containing protein